MKVVFRVDATETVGMGHLARCMRIAVGLKDLGHLVCFILSSASRSYADRVKDFGFETHLFDATTADSYAASEDVWSEQHQLTDAKSFSSIAFKESPDVVIVDHYGLDAIWENAVLHELSDAEIVVVDDLANRQHFCSSLLNYNLQEDPSIYRDLTPASAQILAGLKYAPIGFEYFLHRGKSRAPRREIGKVCIFLGGAAEFGALENVSRAAVSVFGADVEIRVILPTNFEGRERLAVAIGSPTVTLVDPVSSLVEEYSKTDFAIGAAGVASLERLAMGLPSATLITAANQAPGARNVASLSKLPYLDVREESSFESILGFLSSLKRRYRALQKQAFLAQFLVDQHGQARFLLQIGCKPMSELSIRKTQPHDCATYFQWVNEPAVRSNSFSQSLIPINEHFEWFTNALASDKVLLFIAVTDGLPVGQTRFTVDQGEWWLDYSIDRDFRGQGLGNEMLGLALREFALLNPMTKVNAQVKSTNLASLSVLSSCGFNVGAGNDETGSTRNLTWESHG